MAPAAPTPLPAEGGRRERPGQARSPPAAGWLAVSEVEGEAGLAERYPMPGTSGGAARGRARLGKVQALLA